MADNAAAWKELDLLAEQWAALPEAGNEARRQAMAEQLFAGVIALVPASWLDSLGSFWLKEWKHFDPAKGTFSGFVNHRLKRCAQDQVHEDLDQRRLTRPNPGQGENKTQWVARAVSLNTPVTDDSDSELGDSLADPSADRQQLVDGMLLIALALALQTRLPAEQGEHRRYFPLFFTGGVAELVQWAELPGLGAQEERTLFAAMRLPFLDFFTRQVCRSIAAIRATPLKPYGELVDGRPMEETALPLPGDVYIAYLKTAEGYPVSPAAVSRQRKAYQSFGRKLGIF